MKLLYDLLCGLFAEGGRFEALLLISRLLLLRDEVEEVEEDRD